jgi:hypothetical protein
LVYNNVAKEHILSFDNFSEKFKYTELQIRYKSSSNSINVSARGSDFDFKVIKSFEFSNDITTDIVSYFEHLFKKIEISLENNYFAYYNQLAQKFTDNGFIIISDELNNNNNANEKPKLDKNCFKITVSGDNDDRITLTIWVSTRNTAINQRGILIVRVKASSNGMKLDKTKEFSSDEDLVNGIYDLVTHKFSLNAANRCDKVVNTIAHYMGDKYVKTELDKKNYKYTIKNITIVATIEGNGIVYEYNSQTVLSNHFDNILTVAGNLYRLIKPK